jgi:hypothetical protein
MSKAPVFCMALLVCFAWFQAEAAYPKSDFTYKSQYAVQGCLQVLGSRYSLAGDGGQTYKLTGDTGMLQGHAGQEVQVTGVFSVITTDTTQEGLASSVEEILVIQVQSVKQISDTCQSH